jgi:hypothetical protein
MSKHEKKKDYSSVIDEKEYEKLSLGEKLRYLREKREEIDRRVRNLINYEEKQ